MFTKKQRLIALGALAFTILLGGLLGALVAETYYSFHLIAVFMFLGAFLGGAPILVIVVRSLTIEDEQENKNMKDVVNFGDDRIVLIQKHKNSTIIQPLMGNSQRTRIASNKSELLYLTEKTSDEEYIHSGSNPLKYEIMEDEEYQKLFGMRNI